MTGDISTPAAVNASRFAVTLKNLDADALPAAALDLTRVPAPLAGLLYLL